MKKISLSIVLSVSFITTVMAIEYHNDKLFLNIFFGAGTFSAGENKGGSAFFSGSLSLDWIPNQWIGLSYGIETALLGGKEQNNIIYGIPIIFRIGWHPVYFQFEKFYIFILGKAGWGFGIWGDNLDNDSTNGGIVCGINIGGSYVLTNLLRLYMEIGYNYYGLARNSNYPEYPLGYGSGKTYASIGLSFKLF